MQWFILVPATGPYVQQGVRVHCIILHRSAYSRGVQVRREREEAPKSLLLVRMIEASANIELWREGVCYVGCKC